ncbi:MAG: hypothetical protein Q9217_000120 [Psora testacea]
MSTLMVGQPRQCPGGGTPSRIGKPPGSKNKTTLERLQRASAASSVKTDRRRSRDVPQSPEDVSNPDPSTLALGVDACLPQHEGDRYLKELPVTPNYYYPFPASSDVDFVSFEAAPNEDLQCSVAESVVDPNKGDANSIDPINIELLDFGGLPCPAPELPWMGASGDTALASDTDQQLCSGSPDIGILLAGMLQVDSLRWIDSSLSAYSHSLSGTGTSVSLRSVAARLEEAPKPGLKSFGVDLESYPATCQCMQQYIDVLCQLQGIGKRQRPVKVDTLLTCADVTLGTIEQYNRCTSCLDDASVVMQLLVVFQTLVSWTKGACDACSDLSYDMTMRFGQHDLSAEERDVITSTLLTRLLSRIVTALKAILARIERMTRNRQAKAPCGQADTEIEDYRQLFVALLQRCHQLMRQLGMKTSLS